MSERRHNWKYVLEGDHVYPLSWVPPHVVVETPWLTIRESMATIRDQYAWDGCSPASLLWDTWDGPGDPKTGKPQMYYPSLRHDAGYQYILEIAAATGLSVSRVRQHLDDDFRRDGRAFGFRHSTLYFRFVRGLGWIPVLRRRRRARRARG